MTDDRIAGLHAGGMEEPLMQIGAVIDEMYAMIPARPARATGGARPTASSPKRARCEPASTRTAGRG